MPHAMPVAWKYRHPNTVDLADRLRRTARVSGRTTAHELVHLLSVLGRFSVLVVLSGAWTVAFVAALVIAPTVMLGMFVIMSQVW